MKKILIGVFILTSFSLLYYLSIFLFGNSSERIHQHIPEAYIDYPFLDSLSSNSEYSVIRFESTSAGYTDKINDSTICIFTERKIDLGVLNKSWYKINSSGTIIDSLSILDIDEEIYQKGTYIINTKKNQYLTWMLDGDTLRKQFSLIEKGKIIEKEAYQNYRKDTKFSISEFVYDTITGDRIRKTFYFKNNEWNMIYSNKNYYVDEPCCQYTGVPNKPLYEIGTLEFEEVTIKHNEPYIKLNLLFNNNGSSSSRKWDGVLYYSLPIHNNSKFKFKIPTKYEYQIDVYNNTQNKYILISLNKPYKDKKIKYLIKHQ